MPSYHDLYITTKDIPRTSIFNLHYGIEVTCSRTAGWRVWSVAQEQLLAGEFDGSDKWLVLDVVGHVIVDSRPSEECWCYANAGFAETQGGPHRPVHGCPGYRPDDDGLAPGWLETPYG